METPSISLNIVYFNRFFRMVLVWVRAHLRQVLIFLTIFGFTLCIFVSTTAKPAATKLSVHHENKKSLLAREKDDDDDDDHDDHDEKIDITYDSGKVKVVGELQARNRKVKMATAESVISVDPIMIDIAKKSIAKFRPSLFQHADLPLGEAYKKLVEEYLAPWAGLDQKGVPAVKVTQRMLAAMEYAYKGGGFRVRIVNRRIYFRKLVHWKQTYRTQRMLWYLRLLYDILKKDRLLSEATLAKGLDFVIYVGDGAKVAADTFTVEAGFPLFSLRTSILHIDIPIPDPVQHGSNGHYKWTELGKTIPWEERKPQLIFRGRGSCLKMQADNWHFCNRVRLQQLAQRYPNDLDAGIIQWNQVYKAAKMVVPPASIEEIEKSTGIKVVEAMDFDAQSRFKYVIDVDGGLGSSRKPGILSSGSLLLSADSPWYTYYEPLLEPYRHYIPVDRWLRDLHDVVKWAQKNDQVAKRMMEEGRAFEAKFLTVAASKQYMAILLNEYAGKLLKDPVPADSPVEVDYCLTMGNREIEEGPMGCSRDWILFTNNEQDLPEDILLDRKRS